MNSKKSVGMDDAVWEGKKGREGRGRRGDELGGIPFSENHGTAPCTRGKICQLSSAMLCWGGSAYLCPLARKVSVTSSRDRPHGPQPQKCMEELENSGGTGYQTVGSTTGVPCSARQGQGARPGIRNWLEHSKEPGEVWIPPVGNKPNTNGPTICERCFLPDQI